MAHILAFSSQVVYGPVGNSAAVPALQSFGHDVMQLPTVLLSNHPGHGVPEKLAVTPAKFQSMLNKVAALGALQNCDATMTGYFASPEQVEIAAVVIAEIKQRNPKTIVLVDPVIGDNGKLYVGVDTATAIRDHLLPLATITTPNLFELGWLANENRSSPADIVAVARKLPPSTVIVTSVPQGSTELQTLHVTRNDVWSSQTTRRTGVPNGTGDYLAGLYLGALLQSEPRAAFTRAMAELEIAITRSAGGPVLAVAHARNT